MPRTIPLAALVISAILWFTTTVVGATDFRSEVAFSADTVNTAPKGQAVTGKMFVGRDGIRREYTRNGKQVIEITNESKRMAWLLFPQEKTYLEQSSAPPKGANSADKDLSNPCAGAPQSVTCNNLGVENVHGRAADKWEIISSHQERTSRVVQWIDKQRHMPIKQEFPGGSSEYRMIGKDMVNDRQTEKWELTQHQDRDQKTSRTLQWYDPKLKLHIREELPGGYVRELKNIQEGSQPVSLFELPPGYQKKEMPALDQGRGNEPRGSDQHRDQ